MKVYVVMYTGYFEFCGDEDIEAVFDSKKKAEEYINEKNSYYYTIVEKDLQ